MNGWIEPAECAISKGPWSPGHPLSLPSRLFIHTPRGRGWFGGGVHKGGPRRQPKLCPALKPLLPHEKSPAEKKNGRSKAVYPAQHTYRRASKYKPERASEHFYLGRFPLFQFSLQWFSGIFPFIKFSAFSYALCKKKKKHIANAK